MHIDKRLEILLQSHLKDDAEVFDKVIEIIKEYSNGYDVMLGKLDKLSLQPFGFCDTNSKTVYLNPNCLSYIPFTAFLFTIIHELAHTQDHHDINEALKLEYDQFKTEVLKIEKEANDFAKEKMKEISHIGMREKIESTLKGYANVDFMTERGFDQMYGYIYKNFGADFCFEDHVGTPL